MFTQINRICFQNKLSSLICNYFFAQTTFVYGVVTVTANNIFLLNINLQRPLGEIYEATMINMKHRMKNFNNSIRHEAELESWVSPSR